jgi:hypothetical protein
VANVSAPEQLSDSRYVTLILRLLVDRFGELVDGDVGAQAAHESTVRWVHFHGASGLLAAVQASLADERADTQHNLYGRTP